MVAQQAIPQRQAHPFRQLPHAEFLFQLEYRDSWSLSCYGGSKLYAYITDILFQEVVDRRVAMPL